MEQLNNTEKLMLCILGKGLTIKKMCSDKIFTCLKLSEILELIDENAIKLDKKKKITNFNGFNSDRPYLENVYVELKDGKYKKIQSYIEKFIYSLSNKKSKKSIQDIIDYLVKYSFVTEVNKKGLLEDKIEYKVSDDITQEIIDGIIKEFNKENIEDKKIIYLTALLLVSGILAKYVSKNELKHINKEIKVLSKEDPNLFVNEIWNNIFMSEIMTFAASSL